MRLIATDFADLFVIEPRIFRDPRGYFVEFYNQRTMTDLGLSYTFVQDNESQSTFGTLRGLHFQKGDFAQAKLVRAVRGEVLDVAVDLRPDSKTYGKHFSTILSEENKRMVIVPRGFAHGFAVLSETAVFAYKCDNFYSAENEGGLYYNDPDLSIDWQLPADQVLLSDKDKKHPRFKKLI